MASYYHRTDSAEEILRSGFRDNQGSYLLIHMELRGVFLSNYPLDQNEGAKGRQLLAITFPRNFDLSYWELVEESGEQPYREWCVPAEIINQHAMVRLLTAEEEEDIVP